MAYERTWQCAPSFDSYQQLDVPSGAKRRLWAIKAFLAGQIGGATQGLWTVAGSCDGATAGMDGVDRWGSTFTIGKMVQGAAGSAHSWCVLQSPVMNGFTWYMMLALDTVTAAAATIQVAKVAYVGGTITANPTSTDFWSLLSAAGITENAAGTVTTRLHGAISTTGDFFIFSAKLGAGGIAPFGMMVMAPTGAHPSDLYPLFNFAVNDSSDAFGAAYFTGSSINVATKNGIGVGGFNNLSFLSAATPSLDLLSAKLLDSPGWVMVKAGATLHARGRLADIGCTPGTNKSAVADGTTVRDGSNNVIYIIVGNLILPFNAVVDMT
jgi:hypothetical protein